MGFSSMLRPAMMSAAKAVKPLVQQVQSSQQPVAAVVGGTPTAVSGGGLMNLSGIMQLLNDPKIREQLNLSTPVAEQPSAPAANQMSLSPEQQAFMNTDAYKQGYANYLQNLASPGSAVTPNAVSYIDIYEDMKRDSSRLNPFQRRS